MPKFEVEKHEVFSVVYMEMQGRRRGVVTVYHPPGHERGPEVNWSGSDSVPLVEAEAFVAAMQEAIRIAKGLPTEPLPF